MPSQRGAFGVVAQQPAGLAAPRLTTARLSPALPRSFVPLCCVVLYVLLNLVNRHRLRTFNVFVVSCGAGQAWEGGECGSIWQGTLAAAGVRQEGCSGARHACSTPRTPLHPPPAHVVPAPPIPCSPGAATPGGAAAGLQGNQTAPG